MDKNNSINNATYYTLRKAQTCAIPFFQRISRSPYAGISGRKIDDRKSKWRIHFGFTMYSMCRRLAEFLSEKQISDIKTFVKSNVVKLVALAFYGTSETKGLQIILESVLPDELLVAVKSPPQWLYHIASSAEKVKSPVSILHDFCEEIRNSCNLRSKALGT